LRSRIRNFANPAEADAKSGILEGVRWPGALVRA
jgi:hypothetical protein